MTNKTKILVGILALVAIIILIFGIVEKNKSKQVNSNVENEENIFEQYVDDKDLNNIEENNTIENTIEKNEIEQNKVENTINNEMQNNSTNNNNTGREEQESNNENKEVNNQEKAIEMAKKEWAISVNSYNFQAELQSTGIYKVSVINKTDRNVITIYTVDVNAGTVTE